MLHLVCHPERNEVKSKDLLVIQPDDNESIARRFRDYARNDIDTIPYFSPFTSHFSL